MDSTREGGHDFNSIFYSSDLESPNVTCPDDIITQQDLDSKFAVASWPQAIVEDNSGNFSTPVASIISGSEFILGTTIVNITSTDASDNIGSCNFTVTVTGMF